MGSGGTLNVGDRSDIRGCLAIGSQRCQSTSIYVCELTVYRSNLFTIRFLQMRSLFRETLLEVFEVASHFRLLADALTGRLLLA